VFPLRELSSSSLTALSAAVLVERCSRRRRGDLPPVPHSRAARIDFSESGVLGEEEIEVFVTMALRKAEEGEAVELIGCEGAEDVHGITGGLAYVVEIQHGCGTAPRVVGGRD